MPGDHLLGFQPAEIRSTAPPPYVCIVACRAVGAFRYYLRVYHSSSTAARAYFAFVGGGSSGVVPEGEVPYART